MDLFICPKTGSDLVATNSNCLATGDRGSSYEFSGAHPVLVDFDNSVLDRNLTMATSGASIVARQKRSRLGEFAKYLVSASSKKTAANVSAMIEALKLKQGQPRVLVIGGGAVGSGMQELYDDPDIRLVAFDIYASPFVQFVADGHQIPLASQSFDGVIIQAVIEHVLEPNRVISEIFRVLSDNGLVYAETPFLQPVHEGAYDFTRFTDSGHRYLFRKFDAVSSGVLHGPADQLLRSLDYFFRSLFRSHVAGKIAKLLFSWVKVFDSLIPDAYAVDAASSVFFFGEKRNSEISAKDIIGYYQGSN
ncbi:MAG TPA: methyltransferase domain-containing protein [Woeseiaceae bacterium]|nr:methyltransferase domain-containing protein [Woeseiaceae bacterium]